MRKSTFHGDHSQESVRLIRRYQEGRHADALDELFARYWLRVHRIVSIRVGGRVSRTCDVDDLVQETFLAALGAFDRFELREDCRLINWLARIAERKLIDQMKYEHRPKRDRRLEVTGHHRRNGSSVLSSDTMEPEAGGPAAPERVELDELGEILDECIAGLDERYREVIVLRDFADGSWRFVAEEMGCVSEEAARKLHGRARVALLKRLLGRI